MNIFNYPESIDEGHMVILYMGINAQQSLLVERGKVFQTKFGALPHGELIGKPYGSKINLANGYLHVLRPTPSLWTRTLPHRTQILYDTDISLILYQLEIRSGSIVAECGTGSGSLSHAIISAILPNGYLHTFDFHESRVAAAQKEFMQHGLSDSVTVSCRDVCADGFGLTEKVDAVFLDVPKPWLAVPLILAAFRKNSLARFCSFSPCIEQVQRTVSALSECSFFDVHTYECLLRNYFVDTIQLKSHTQFLNMKNTDSESTDSYDVASQSNEAVGHTGYLTFASIVAT